MCDDLRATSTPSTDGFPLSADITAVQNYINMVRPVTADVFVAAPIPQAINFTITNLVGDSSALRAAIAASVEAMLFKKAAPASTFNGVGRPPVNIPSAWVSDAIYQAVNGVAFDLTMADAAMANNGCMAVLGTIS